MSKENLRFIIIVVLLAGLWLYTMFVNFNQKEDTKFIKEINKLEQKIDNLSKQKDSIRIAIDSTHVKIVTNEKHYQEIVNTIISQPTDSDYVFILDYIRQHRNERDSTNLR